MTLVEHRNLSDHFLNPTSLLSATDDLRANVQVIASIITTLQTAHRQLSPVIALYRAEFLDLTDQLCLPILLRTARFFEDLRLLLYLRHNETTASLQCQTLTGRLRKRTHACETFMTLESVISQKWQSRSNQLIDDLNNQRRTQSTLAQLFRSFQQQIWPDPSFSDTPNDQTIKAIADLLRALSETLDQLKKTVERIDVYWRKRIDIITRQVGPLRLAWSDAMLFGPAWELACTRFGRLAYGIVRIASKLTSLNPAISMYKPNAEWFPLKKENSTPGRTDRKL